MRGLAALTVVLAHLHVVLPDPLQAAIGIADGPLGFLATGRAAVILFFVLSGFVLSLSLSSPRAPGFAAFATRRLCRIYLPFAVVILLAAGLKALVQPAPIPELGSWLARRAWNLETTPELLLGHLAMLGRWRDSTLDPAIWSLVIELRVSLLFPLLYHLVVRRLRSPAIAAAGSLVVTLALGLSPLLPLEPYNNNSLTEVPLLVVYFASFFMLGILLAERRETLIGWVRRRGAGGRGLLLAGALGLLAVQLDVAYALAAALLLLLAAGSPLAERWLKRPALQWLGRVSYSLYLTHLPVLLTVLHLGHGRLPLPVILAAALVAALIVAELAHRAIEAPAIRLGRHLTGKAPRPRPAPVRPEGPAAAALTVERPAQKLSR